MGRGGRWGRGREGGRQKQKRTLQKKILHSTSHSWLDFRDHTYLQMCIVLLNQSNRIHTVKASSTVTGSDQRTHTNILSFNVGQAQSLFLVQLGFFNFMLLGFFFVCFCFPFSKVIYPHLVSGVKRNVFFLNNRPPEVLSSFSGFVRKLDSRNKN